MEDSDASIEEAVVVAAVGAKEVRPSPRLAATDCSTPRAVRGATKPEAEGEAAEEAEADVAVARGRRGDHSMEAAEESLRCESSGEEVPVEGLGLETVVGWGLRVRFSTTNT